MLPGIFEYLMCLGFIKKGFYPASGEFSDVGSGQHYITISFAKIAAILDFLSFLYVLEKNW